MQVADASILDSACSQYIEAFIVSIFHGKSFYIIMYILGMFTINLPAWSIILYVHSWYVYYCDRLLTRSCMHVNFQNHYACLLSHLHSEYTSCGVATCIVLGLILLGQRIWPKEITFYVHS